MKKKKVSLFNEMMDDKKFKKKYLEEKNFFEIEYQLMRIMEDLGISQKDLAEKLGIDKSVVSKDLSGALKKAGVKSFKKLPML